MQSNHESDSQSKIDWQNLPVHPAAEILPMMSDEEIEGTRRDISTNSLLEPLDIFVDNHAEANGAKGPFPMSLLDGRGRLEAIRRNGHKSPFEVNKHGVRYRNAIKWDRKRKRWIMDCDPYAYVVAKNVHRRHLTADQKRDAIAAYIKADPQASNRKVAKALKVDDHTVADVREETALNAGIPQMAHVAMERAKAAIVENPGASGREIAKIAGVVEATIRRARKDLAKKPQPGTKPTEPAIDASATASAAANRKALTDEVAAALEPIWQKWHSANPELTWRMFTGVVKRFLKTGREHLDFPY